MKKIVNYRKINDQIVTSGQPTKKQFKTIAQNGYDVVINLAMHNRGALKEEDKIVTKNGMVYYHIPVVWKAPTIENLKLFCATLQMLEQQNKKVFIHCIMNYRASMFIYMYKKHILKEENAVLDIPDDHKPKKVWQKLLEAKI